MKFDKGMIVRTVILIIALVNQFLVSFGKSPLPIADEQIETLISTAFTVIASVWAWWKDNDVTRKARERTEILKEMGLK